MTKSQRYGYKNFKKRAKQRLMNEKKLYKERCQKYKQIIKQGMII